MGLHRHSLSVVGPPEVTMEEPGRIAGEMPPPLVGPWMALAVNRLMLFTSETRDRERTVVYRLCIVSIQCLA